MVFLVMIFLTAANLGPLLFALPILRLKIPDNTINTSSSLEHYCAPRAAAALALSVERVLAADCSLPAA
jgi:hypothetical protein